MAAKTSTRAPAADSNSTFHAAASLPPATTARLPLRSKKAGSRDSGAIAVRTDSGAQVMMASQEIEWPFTIGNFACIIWNNLLALATTKEKIPQKPFSGKHDHSKGMPERVYANRIAIKLRRITV